jgi:hypothetical protein
MLQAEAVVEAVWPHFVYVVVVAAPKMVTKPLEASKLKTVIWKSARAFIRACLKMGPCRALGAFRAASVEVPTIQQLLQPKNRGHLELGKMDS